MRFTKFIPAIFFASILIFLAECDKLNIDGTDRFPPREVNGLKTEPGNGIVNFTWNDPADPDFAAVNICWDDTTVGIAAGIEEATIAGLQNDTIYSFKIRTKDWAGNMSPGIVTSVFPQALPAIEWLNDPVSVLDTSALGNLTGGFITTRSFINTSHTGYVNFTIRTIDLATDSVTGEESRNILVPAGIEYNFICDFRGDVTIYNCSACNTAIFSKRIEFSIDNGEETFYTELPACTPAEECPNGNNTSVIRWNSLSIKYIDITETK